MRVLIDTSVVLRNSVRTDPQHGLVKETLERIVAAVHELCVGSQVWAEFWVVATRPLDRNGLGLAPTDARVEIDASRPAFTLLLETPGLVDDWLDLCSTNEVKGARAHDTRLVALMRAHGLTHLVTLNPVDFSRYSDIVVLTPGGFMSLSGN